VDKSERSHWRLQLWLRLVIWYQDWVRRPLRRVIRCVFTELDKLVALMVRLFIWMIRTS